VLLLQRSCIGTYHIHLQTILEQIYSSSSFTRLIRHLHGLIRKIAHNECWSREGCTSPLEVFFKFTDSSRERLGKPYDIARRLLAQRLIVHSPVAMPSKKQQKEKLDRCNRLQLYIISTGRLLSTFLRSVLAPFKVWKCQILWPCSLNTIYNCFISLIRNLTILSNNALSFLLHWPKTFVRNSLECAILNLKGIYFLNLQ